MKTTKPSENAERRKLLGMIHLAAKKAGWDKDLYRLWLERQTGKDSAADLSIPELDACVAELRKMKLLESFAVSADRPTQKQRHLLAKLAEERGWSKGLKDPCLTDFIKRTAKVDDLRFLDRRGMSNVITALKRWNTQTTKEVPHVDA